MKRQIIHIEADKCNGCGSCVPDCPEGAIQMIDGKARLISDIFCDGLGACIGNCPTGAITTEEREAEAYDEAKVMENIIPAGPNTIKAHLKHLNAHGLDSYVNQAVQILTAKNIEIPEFREKAGSCATGHCPGSNARTIDRNEEHPPKFTGNLQSRLKHWPVQLHLVNPADLSLDNADLLICADCVPFAFANFHDKFLKDKRLVMLCPKLDQNIERYIAKLTNIFQNKSIKSVSIVRMEVPCCGGIETIVQRALEAAGVSKMIKLTVIGINGEIQ